MDKVIKALADYFTGTDVVHHSIGLQVGGDAGKRAERFFAVREVLGIRGYDDASEAAAAIRDRMGQ